MLYMIELHFKESSRDAALSYFWKHGSSHYDGKISVVDLWVATLDRVAYALIKSFEKEEVQKACAPLEQFGHVKIRSVASADEL